MSTTERSWSLAAAIASVTVFGLSVGQAAPLLSLLLEARGTDVVLNGLNAATTFIGVILGPLLVPYGVRKLGFRAFLLLGQMLDIAAFLLLHVFDGIGPWFALRLGLGIIGANVFAASEAWINQLAAGPTRGRILGMYAAALSAGFGLGPLLLTVTGLHGWLPFLANAGLTGLASLPLLALGHHAPPASQPRAAGFAVLLARAPGLFLVVGLFGLFEATLIALLPVWSVREGMTNDIAAATLTAFYIGAVVLQVPIGWLSDRLPRRVTLRLCAIVGLVGALALALPKLPLLVLLPLLFMWGGIASGIYPVALGIAGDRFHGADLVRVNAGMISAYGAGGLVGPALGGVAIEWNGAIGLPTMFALLFVAFLLVMTLRNQRSDASTSG